MRKLLFTLFTICTLILTSSFPSHAMDSNFYDIMGEDLYEFTCIKDCTWSMKNTFSYESNLIYSNMKNMKFGEEIQFTDSLWGTLNGIINENIFLISDLWDTSNIELEDNYSKNVFILVPYYSTFSEGVTHVENVVNYILDKWDESAICVLYLDDVEVYFTNIYVE